jgi:hypothetical protein
MDRPRQVRCSSCKTTWTAGGESEPEETPSPAPPLLGEETPPYRPEAVAEAALDIVVEPAIPADAQAPVEPAPRKAKAKSKARARKPAAARAIWGGLAAALVLLVACAALFRNEVVRIFPATAGAYVKLGLTVNPIGLAPEGIEAGPGLSGGHAAVIVTGKLRNVQDRAHAPAPLRIILMDQGGRHLIDRVLPAAGRPLQPGESRPFQLAFLDPPSGAVQVQVEFAFDAMGAAPAARASAETAARVAEADRRAAELRLRGALAPSPPEAIPAKVVQPLSEDSPYALPEAARTRAGNG